MAKHEPFHGDHGPFFNFMEADLDSTDFMHSTYLVSVTGITPWGHALLCVRDYYFHVDSPFWSYPRWMDEAGYKRYMRENAKRELSRIRIHDINQPERAKQQLNKMLKEEFFWGGAVHNCETFAEIVWKAGGSRCSPRQANPAAAAKDSKRWQRDLSWQRPVLR